MFQNEYELVIIIRPDLDDAPTNEATEKIEAIVSEGGGHLLVRDDWGKRKLAYPIGKHLKGHYVLLGFLAPAELIAEIERRIRITDAIIRFLTVKKFDAVDVEPRLLQAAEQRRLREEEAARHSSDADDDSDGKDDTSDERSQASA